MIKWMLIALASIALAYAIFGAAAIQAFAALLRIAG
jgi:hypothetical protein